MFPSALLWTDFIAEATTRYGENLCDSISFKFADKAENLKKEMSKYNKTSAISKEEIIKEQRELGVLPNQKNVLIMDFPKEKMGNDNEKNC